MPKEKINFLFPVINLMKSKVEKKIKLKKIKMWFDDANLLLNDFLDSLRKKKDIYKINSDHLKSLAVVDACIKSSKTGKKVRILS